MTSEVLHTKDYTLDSSVQGECEPRGPGISSDLLKGESKESQLDKSDSGMEEESSLHTSGISQPSDAEERSEDEDDFGTFAVRKSMGKRKLVIDDEEDEENDEESHAQESGTDNDADKNDDTEEKHLGEDSEAADAEAKEDMVPDDQNHEQERNESDEENGDDIKLKFDFKSSDVFDAEESDEDRQGNQSDEDVDGDREQGDSDNNAGDVDGSDNGDDDGDEGFDEGEISPSLLAKLKKMKGAAKSGKDRAKYSRKAKPSAGKMMELYSESQRLVRESRINLPYYEPQPKSLDDFLARAAKKKQMYAGLRHAKDFQKAKIIQDQLSIAPPKPSKPAKTKPRSDTKKSSMMNSNLSQTSSNGQKSSKTPLVDESDLTNSLHESQKLDVVDKQSQDLDGVETAIENDTSPGCADDSGVASQGLTSQSSTVVLQSSLDPSLADSVRTETDANGDDDDDELPDLEPKPQGSMVSNSCPVSADVRVEEDAAVAAWRKEQGAEVCDMDTSHSSLSEMVDEVVGGAGKLQILTEGGKATQLTSGREDSICEKTGDLHVPSLQKDPSRDLFRSQSSVGGESDKLATLHSQDHEKQSDQSHGERDQADLPTVIQETQCTEVSALTCTNSQQLSQEDEHMIEAIKREEELATPQSRRMERLKNLELPANPHLSGTPDQIICLDEPQTMPVQKMNPGMIKLMDRLAQHARKSTPRPARDVNFSIVQKEGEGGKQELTLKSMTYHVKEEVAPLMDGTPGSKLTLLKQQLGVGMRKKREEARQRRLQLYALENEEGFGGEKEEENNEEEEDEAEMTDNSDSEEDEEDDEEDDFELRFNNSLDDSDDGKDYNPLMDMEAKDDDDEEEEDDERYSYFEEDSDEVHLRLDVSDEEDEDGDTKDEDDVGDSNKSLIEKDDEDDEIELTSLRKRKRKRGAKVVESDEDEDETNVKRTVGDDDGDDDDDRLQPNVARTNHEEDADPIDSLWSSELTPLTRHLQDTQPPQGQTRFRRENSRSPDLYSTGVADESQSSLGRSFDHLNDSSQSYDQLHSQLLDADGYLKMPQTQPPPKSRIALLAQQPADESTSMGDWDSSLKMSAGNIFHASDSQARTGVDDDDDDNMRELMGLCSGTFGPQWDSEDAFPSSQNGIKSTQSFEIKSSGINNSSTHENDDIYDPFHVLSDDEYEDATNNKHTWKKPLLSDSEDEREVDDDERQADTDVEEGEDIESNQPVKFTGFKEKKKGKGIKREFVEDEAELSGSEYESDEDLDLAEEEDILEEEAGDRDMAGVSAEKLRDEVGRLHMKQLQDEDDREVMRFKEMYLQDGDLYTEGGGRMRNFRWRDIDQNSQSDMFGHQSDEEQGEEEGEDLQWRKERYEREKFIDEVEPTADSENSQMLKFGQFFLKKKESITPLAKTTSDSDINIVKPLPPPPPPPPKPKLQKKGSFLSRGKDTLVKIARVTKGIQGGQSAKNSRNFVFQTVESQETQDENMETPQQPPKRKAHSAGHSGQVTKKPKIVPVSSFATPTRPHIKRQNSIFNLLEDK